MSEPAYTPCECEHAWSSHREKPASDERPWIAGYSGGACVASGCECQKFVASELAP
jgi:hypothetical protein